MTRELLTVKIYSINKHSMSIIFRHTMLVYRDRYRKENSVPRVFLISRNLMGLFCCFRQAEVVLAQVVKAVIEKVQVQDILSWDPA
jgi:hypothetical protein